MTAIRIYDRDAERMEKITEEFDTINADLISVFLDMVENEDIDLTEWL